MCTIPLSAQKIGGIVSRSEFSFNENWNYVFLFVKFTILTYKYLVNMLYFGLRGHIIKVGTVCDGKCDRDKSSVVKIVRF
jgi:hypothetical protein